MKLLELLGVKRFNKLKKLLGEKFDNVEAIYDEATKDNVGGVEDDESTTDNVDADTIKKEDEIDEKDPDISEGDITENVDDEKPNADDIEKTTNDAEEIKNDDDEINNDDNVVENVDVVKDRELNLILGDGWLKENGDVDLSKILDEGLKGYIEKLHKQLDDINQEMLKELIKGEARSQGAVEIDDILRFIDISKIQKEDIAKSVSTLKKDKGYLFTDATNKGFNPSSSKSRAKYRQGMSFSDALDITE